MIRTLNHSEVLSILPDRKPEAHKGDFGRILLLCGSKGFTGAAALAAMGALRCGAGLVYLGVPESVYAIEAVKLTEPVVFSLPDQNGMFSRDAVKEILLRLPTMQAVLIGCGMGCSDDTRMVVEAVLRNAQCPVVLDADGINVIAGHMDILRERTAATILTPHEGEFRRVGGDLAGDRTAAVKHWAGKWNSILLLKGHKTCISDGEILYINDTGNPGMAVGGSGDLLAGMITALLGQGLCPMDAASCGAWIHGAAGDLASDDLGQYGMLPSDMLNYLPRLLK